MLSKEFGATYFSVGAGVGVALSVMRGGYLAAGAFATLALAAIVLRLYWSGSFPELNGTHKKRLRQTSTVAVVALVLVAAIMGPLTGIAAAGLGFQDCNLGDSLVGAFITGFVSPNQSGDCRFNPDDGSYANLSHTEHYSQGLTQDQNNDNFLTAGENFQKEARMLAWSEAKLAAVNSLNKGSNASEISEAMNESVDDYLSQHQYQVLNQQSTGTVVGEYIWEDNASHVAIRDGNNHTVAGFVDVEYQLLNGTKIWVRSPIDSTGTVPAGNRATGNFSNVTGGEYNESELSTMFAGSPDDFVATNVTTDMGQNPLLYSEVANLSSFGRASNLEADIYFAAEGLRQQTPQYASAINTTYNASELNVTDVLSPAELAGRAGSDYSSTGYYGFLATELAALGYSGDFNSSVTMNWTRNGSTVTYDGTPFYTGDDLQKLERNTSYNATSLNGTFVLAAQKEDGNGTFIEVDKGDFTLTSITNPNTGESLNNTSLVDYSYNSTSADDLEGELENMSEARDYYYEQQSAAGGGWNFNLGGTQTGVIIALAAVVFLLGRD